MVRKSVKFSELIDVKEGEKFNVVECETSLEILLFLMAVRNKGFKYDDINDCTNSDSTIYPLYLYCKDVEHAYFIIYPHNKISKHILSKEMVCYPHPFISKGRYMQLNKIIRFIEIEGVFDSLEVTDKDKINNCVYPEYLWSNILYQANNYIEYKELSGHAEKEEIEEQCPKKSQTVDCNIEQLQFNRVFSNNNCLYDTKLYINYYTFVYALKVIDDNNIEDQLQTLMNSIGIEEATVTRYSNGYIKEVTIYTNSGKNYVVKKGEVILFAVDNFSVDDSNAKIKVIKGFEKKPIVMTIDTFYQYYNRQTYNGCPLYYKYDKPIDNLDNSQFDVKIAVKSSRSIIQKDEEFKRIQSIYKGIYNRDMPPAESEYIHDNIGNFDALMFGSNFKYYTIDNDVFETLYKPVIQIK